MAQPTEGMIARCFCQILIHRYRYPGHLMFVKFEPGLVRIESHSTHFELNSTKSMEQVLQEDIMPAIRRMFPETQLLDLGLGLL